MISTVLYCTVLDLYCTVLYCTVLYCTVVYCTVLQCTVLYCSVLEPYCTLLHCTVLDLYCTGPVLYCAVLYLYPYLYCTAPVRCILYSRGMMAGSGRSPTPTSGAALKGISIPMARASYTSFPSGKKRLSMFVELQDLKHCDCLQLLRSKISSKLKQMLFPNSGLSNEGFE